MMTQGSIGRILNVSFNPGSTNPPTITAGSPAHTKGAWTEIVGGLGINASAIMLRGTVENVYPNEEGNSLIDIGMGAAGSERVIIPNLFHPSSEGMQVLLPVRFPAGQRLAVRMQSVIASATMSLMITMMDQGYWSPPGFDLVESSADLANSRGHTLTDPGAAHTKGAWTELIASTSFAAKKMLVVVDKLYGEDGDAKSTVDIGVGSAGNEVVIVPDIYTWHKQFSSVGRLPYSLWDVNIPPGSRVAARYQSAGSAAGGRELHCQVMLFG